MNHGEYLHLLGEKTALERMIAETPEEDVLDRASLVARLRRVEVLLAQARPEEREPARVTLTFRGRPVIGSHGIFAEFGMRAVNSFAESVVAMAASLTGPLAERGRIPNRDQHQLLITSTAQGSFGFELEEHRTGQLSLGEASAVAQALDRTQQLLRGTLGTDDELAESAAEANRRALDKVRVFLQTLVDHEAVCTVQLGDSRVAFSDVGQVRTSLERLSQENLREEQEKLLGEFQGVLPRSRSFEFKIAGSEKIIRGKIGPEIADPDALNLELHRPARIKVLVTRVGTGRPRYLLIEPPEIAESE
ncbi:MAG TPA: hypothetical protein VK539_06960 [Myxococcaceae bacterium]|nr:hypothetical protein [Myxococcaceae bacterium]